jgi:hypothetical protein
MRLSTETTAKSGFLGSPIRGTVRLAAMIATVLTLCSLSTMSTAQYSGHKERGAYDYEDIFPLFGKQLAARGIRFPRPWGIGLTYAYIQQPIDISRIALGVNDGAMVDVSDVIKFQSVDSQVHALNLRVDLWVLPFLNVYVLGNYAPNAKSDITLSEPFALEAGAEQWLVGEGFGMTGAFGMFGAWFTLDANWTWNHAELIDDAIRTTLITPRVGMNVARWKDYGIDVWLGTMAQIIGVDTKGAIKLSDALGGQGDAFRDRLNTWYEGLPPPQQRLVENVAERLQGAGTGDPTIRYELDKQVAQRWNMVVGAQFAIGDRWFIRGEASFIQRESFLLGFNYRFNTPGFRGVVSP